jgi:ketosteroid isomerase-like protein
MPEMIDGLKHNYPQGSPLEALNEFYDAFNNRSLEKIGANWLNTDEALVDSSAGPTARGWNAIRQMYERVFQAPATSRTALCDFAIHEHGDIFYATGRDRGDLRTDSTSIPLEMRVTRIFRKLDGKWRQVYYHGSFEDPQQFTEVRKTVTAKAGR